jgi:hypothetical protein
MNAELFGALDPDERERLRLLLLKAVSSKTTG